MRAGGASPPSLWMFPEAASACRAGAACAQFLPWVPGQGVALGWEKGPSPSAANASEEGGVPEVAESTEGKCSATSQGRHC